MASNRSCRRCNKSPCMCDEWENEQGVVVREERHSSPKRRRVHPVFLKVEQSATQIISVINTPTIVTLANIKYISNHKQCSSMFGPGSFYSNGTYTVPNGYCGMYQLGGHLLISNTSGGSATLHMEVIVNGVPIATHTEVLPNNQSVTTACSTIDGLTGCDKVSVRITATAVVSVMAGAGASGFHLYSLFLG